MQDRPLRIGHVPLNSCSDRRARAISSYLALCAGLLSAFQKPNKRGVAVASSCAALIVSTAARSSRSRRLAAAHTACGVARASSCSA